MSFLSATELADWLMAKGVDLSQWGQGSAKSVPDLWHEIVNDEAVIMEAPLLRVVEVVTVIVRDGDRILIETEQEFKDGRRRARNRPPSDKIKLGESYSEAAIRCLDEELGVASEKVKIMTNTHQVTEVVREALSYPGLSTRYHLHRVEAQVRDFATLGRVIPTEGTQATSHSFRTAESPSSASTDPIQYHYWAWQKE